MCESPENVCAVCGVVSELKCTACKKVAYCGAEHQKNHWKFHKELCKCYDIKSDEKCGRYLEANRVIPAKSVILSELPIVIGPKWNSDDAEEFRFKCVGCFETIKVLQCKCERCGWPSCNSGCIGLDNKLLHDIECQILSIGLGPKNQTDIKSIHDYFRNDSMMALKCLILQRKSPKKWKQILEMESHEKERKPTANFQEAEDRIAYLQENFLNRLNIVEEKTGQKILPQKDKKTLHKIFGALETNAMYISLSSGQEICGLFPTGYLLEHSCTPNCYYTFDMTNGFKLTVRAAREIKKGEHLSTMYTHMLWATYLRQQHLKETKYFACACSRCLDPTELGTYLSALRCLGTDDGPCNGIQVPADPLSETTDWACNKCQVRVDIEQVMSLTTKMGEEVDNILTKKSNAKDLEDLLEKLATFLHPNHYHMFSIKHSLIQIYGNHKDLLTQNLPNAILKKKLRMCDELLKIVNTLDPHSIRLPIYTSIILFEKHTVIAELDDREMGSEDLKSALECLQEAEKILANELDLVEAKKLNQRIIQAIYKIECNISNKS